MRAVKEGGHEPGRLVGRDPGRVRVLVLQALGPARAKLLTGQDRGAPGKQAPVLGQRGGGVLGGVDVDRHGIERDALEPRAAVCAARAERAVPPHTRGVQAPAARERDRVQTGARDAAKGAAAERVHVDARGAQVHVVDLAHAHAAVVIGAPRVQRGALVAHGHHVRVAAGQALDARVAQKVGRDPFRQHLALRAAVPELPVVALAPRKAVAAEGDGGAGGARGDARNVKAREGGDKHRRAAVVAVAVPECARAAAAVRKHVPRVEEQQAKVDPERDLHDLGAGKVVLEEVVGVVGAQEIAVVGEHGDDPAARGDRAHIFRERGEGVRDRHGLPRDGRVARNRDRLALAGAADVHLAARGEHGHVRQAQGDGAVHGPKFSSTGLSRGIFARGVFCDGGIRIFSEIYLFGEVYKVTPRKFPENRSVRGTDLQRDICTQKIYCRIFPEINSADYIPS